DFRNSIPNTYKTIPSDKLTLSVNNPEVLIRTRNAEQRRLVKIAKASAATEEIPVDSVPASHFCAPPEAPSPFLTFLLTFNTPNGSQVRQAIYQKTGFPTIGGPTSQHSPVLGGPTGVCQARNLQPHHLSHGPVYCGPFQAVEPFLNWIKQLKVLFETKGAVLDKEKLRVTGGFQEKEHSCILHLQCLHPHHFLLEVIPLKSLGLGLLKMGDTESFGRAPSEAVTFGFILDLKMKQQVFTFDKNLPQQALIRARIPAMMIMSPLQEGLCKHTWCIPRARPRVSGDSGQISKTSCSIQGYQQRNAVSPSPTVKKQRCCENYPGEEAEL
ncbi:hypothetical protein VP01_5248g1, partial [Puccinia sorghi]